MIRRLRSFLPADLRGQVAGILLVGLIASQLLAAALYTVLLPRWERVLRPGTAVARIDMVVRLLESVAPKEREGFARLSSDDDFLLSYEPVEHAPLEPLSPGNDDIGLRTRLAAKLKKTVAEVQVEPQATHGWPQGKRVEVALRGGGRLEVVTPIGLEDRRGLVVQAGFAAFLVFATGGLWVWLTRMVNAPLSRVARAAEGVGLDIHAPQLPEQGPAQLQRVIRAFNDMQQRLQRFLTDRTLMLSAISHDLRTPLTRLRLRIETGRMAEEKHKMIQDIELMEDMVVSAHAFVRGVDDAETHDAVDLALLLQTVCDTVSDLGGEVEYTGLPHCRYRCKPQALMRALTNVTSNAAKYGRRAHVSLDRAPQSGYVVEVQDEGPGICEGEKAKVFEPFYRTAAARNLDSQGMGLGLSIARSIILGHGGTIDLLDRAPGGLRVRIVLPEPSAG